MVYYILQIRHLRTKLAYPAKNAKANWCWVCITLTSYPHPPLQRNAASFLYAVLIIHSKPRYMSEQNNAAPNPKLQEFFITSLQEIYWSETHLVNVLTSMGKAATDPVLKEAFDLHSEQTGQHIQRLQQVFNLMGLQPQAEPSVGLQGLFDEGWQVIDETEDGSAVRDVALIVAAQKVEHYEIACYGSLITLAKTIGLKEVATILGPTLEEEKETDAALTSIAESGINEEATTEDASAGSQDRPSLNMQGAQPLDMQGTQAAAEPQGTQGTGSANTLGAQTQGKEDVNMEQGAPTSDRVDDAGLEINEWATQGAGSGNSSFDASGQTDDSGFGQIASGPQNPDGGTEAATGGLQTADAGEQAINKAASASGKADKGGKKGKSKSKSKA
jgi:ferritin-like metal-binding protein YciE